MRSLLRLTCLSLVVSTVCFAQQAAKPASDTAARIARIENAVTNVTVGKDQPPLRLTIAELMRAYNEPAFSVAVIDNFKIDWANGYGVREAGSKDPVTEKTMFQAASISKPVTAGAALALVEQGKLSLDANVNDLLKSWKVPDNEFTEKEKVTLRRIQSHTAGLTVHGFGGYDVDDPLPTVVQILNGEKPANSPPVRVEAVPGSRVSYSGGGVTIEQLLLTDVTGKPFPQLMRELVLDRVGMPDSSFEQPLPAGRAQFATSATDAEGKTIHGKWHVYPEMAAAGLWTTPSDLSRYLIEIAQASLGKSSRVLSPAMAKQMLTPVNGDAALGFFIMDHETGRFGHGGYNEGFQSLAMINPQTGQGIVVMGDSENTFEVMKFFTAAVAHEYGWKNAEAPDAGNELLLIAVVRGVEPAIKRFDQTKNAEKPDPGPLNFVGERLSALGKTQDGIAAYQHVIKEFPENAGAYEGLGNVYSKSGQKDRAIEYFQKALQLDPKKDYLQEQIKKLQQPK